LEVYIETHPEAQYIPVSEYPEGGHAVWSIPCYAAFPCATQNELTAVDAKNHVKPRSIVQSLNSFPHCTWECIYDMIEK